MRYLMRIQVSCEAAIENIRIAIREYLETVDEDLRRENGALAIVRDEVLV